MRGFAAMYIDYDYYTNEYEGICLDESEFKQLAKRADNVIDVMSFGRLLKGGFGELCNYKKELVKKAAAAQVEFLAENGGASVLAGGIGLSSFKIGSFNAAYKISSDRLVSPLTKSFMAMSGLMYSGAQVCI